MTFERLEGLPAYGPPAERFSATGMGNQSEGVVVRFETGSESWVGNFQRGLSSYDDALEYPGQPLVIVIAGGNAYVVDPKKKIVVRMVGGAITRTFWVKELQLLVLEDQELSFEGIGADGRSWHTQRLSWDGFQNVAIAGKEIRGQGFSPMTNDWTDFTVDLETGKSTGGAYQHIDAKNWERINH